MKNESGFSWLIILLGLGAAYGSYNGWFYQTGQQWFDSCWSSIHSQGTAKTPAEAIAWQQCEPEAKGALFDAGYVFAGNPQYAATPELKAVNTACPSNFTDIPMGGVNVLAVDLIQKDGGPGILDKLAPPDRMIVRAFNKRWPNCASTRAANGFPRLVRKGDDWDWSEPCKPCEAEKAAKGG
jgi:hypothetical protein